MALKNEFLIKSSSGSVNIFKNGWYYSIETKFLIKFKWKKIIDNN